MAKRATMRMVVLSRGRQPREHATGRGGGQAFLAVTGLDGLAPLAHGEPEQHGGRRQHYGENDFVDRRPAENPRSADPKPIAIEPKIRKSSKL